MKHFLNPSQLITKLCLLLFFFSAGNANAATWTVSNPTDGGVNSLRDIIDNKVVNGDIVQFSAFIQSVGVTTLNGPITINHDIIVSASNWPGGIELRRNGAGRMFEIPATSFVLFSGITFLGIPNNVSQANADGNIIRNNGKLTLYECVFKNTELQTSGGNYYAQGGAISNHGTLYIHVSSFSGNKVTGQAHAYGGAIFNDGVLEVVGSTFDYCRATGPAFDRGGAIYSTGPTTIDDCSFHECKTDAGPAHMEGGALYSTTALTLNNCSFTKCGAISNTWQARGGAICSLHDLTLKYSTFDGNQATSYGSRAYGGAVHCAGYLSATDCLFKNNSATGFEETHGGAISLGAGGGILVDRCELLDNVCFDNTIPNWSGGDAFGGAISAKLVNGNSQNQLVILNSTLAGNLVGNLKQKTYGGAVYFTGNNALVANATISGNESRAGNPNGSDSQLHSAYGGGLHIAADVFYMYNSTVVNNKVARESSSVGEKRGGGIFVKVPLQQSFFNNIFADNEGSDDIRTFPNATQSCCLVSNGNNLVEIPGPQYTVAGTDIIGSAPQLLPLALYGGPTRTHAPDCGSPVRDAGRLAGAPPIDQRGFARPAGSAVDIGAVETFDLGNISIVAPPSGCAGSCILVECSDPNLPASSYNWSILSGGSNLNANGHTACFTLTGTAVIQLVVTDDVGCSVTLTHTIFQQKGCSADPDACCESSQKASVGNQPQEIAIEVFPNPTNGMLSVSANLAELNAENGVRISVRDLYGKTVLTETAPPAAGQFSHRMDCSSLPPAVYILNVQFGEKQLSKKFVVTE